MIKKRLNNGDAWVKKRLQGKNLLSKTPITTPITKSISKGSRQNINVGETGLTVRTKINENFIETYKSLLGIQRIKIEWASGSSLIFRAGYVEIGETIYEIPAQFIKTAITGLSASTWYYIYVNPPTTGIEITTTQIEIEDTVPTLNDPLMAYYHPTNTTWRCIGIIYADTGPDIAEFYLEGSQYFYGVDIQDFEDLALTDTPTVMTFTIPPMIRCVIATSIFRQMDVQDPPMFLYYNNTGTNAITKIAGFIRLNTNTSFNTQVLATNSIQQGYFRHSRPTRIAEFSVYTTGFLLPSEFYN